MDTSNLSKADKLKLLPVSQRKKFWADLTDIEKAELAVSISFLGRPKQQPPPKDQRITAIIAGRGFGAGPH